MWSKNSRLIKDKTIKLIKNYLKNNNQKYEKIGKKYKYERKLKDVGSTTKWEGKSKRRMERVEYAVNTHSNMKKISGNDNND